MKFDKTFGFALAVLVAFTFAVIAANATDDHTAGAGELTAESCGDCQALSAPTPKPFESNPVSQPIQLVQFACDSCNTDGCTDCEVNEGNGCGQCGSTTACDCNFGAGFGYQRARPQRQLVQTCQPRSQQAPGPVKSILGVNEFVCNQLGREPTFKDSQLVPWEMFGYAEYLGPHRTPHVAEYRLRVNDQLEFVYYRSRRQSATPYQIYVGDVIQISSATDEAINQSEINVLSDGMVSLPLIGQVRAAGKTISDLQDELNERYEKYLTDPSILVQIVRGDTPFEDIRAAVDARNGTGGQVRLATVSPDGTIQIPVVGSVPAVGLTLDEIRREVNARYRDHVSGLEVTPVLVERAPRFIYVVGQVSTPGRFELVGPTTVMQAIALAEGDLQGGNLRNIVVFRRDEAWRLTATRLDLAGAIHGKRPFPADEIFLRDSDIVLIPRKPITRISEAVDLYLTRTLYAAVPQEVLFRNTFQDVFSNSNANGNMNGN